MNEIIVLDTDFKAIAILESLESTLWTDRYCGYGDFEIYTPVDTTLLAQLKEDYYLEILDSDSTMIIEKVAIDSDAENGNRLVVTGRSLASILLRRIVWNQTVLTGNLQTAILGLLDDNIISPTDTTREIDNFVYVASTDTDITSLTVESQETEGYIYDIITKLCKAEGLGFKVVLNDDLEFEFSLYKGSDRSFEQLDNPYVTFSPNFENVITSNYRSDSTSKRTVNLVLGAGEPSDRLTKTVIVADGAGTGIDRREMYTDARDISEEVDGVPLTETEYLAQLEQRGNEELALNTHEESFESQVDAEHMFVYGEDFFMGDIVQISNEYGNEGRARVTELIQSVSASGSDVYPTFETI